MQYLQCDNVTAIRPSVPTRVALRLDRSPSHEFWSVFSTNYQRDGEISPVSSGSKAPSTCGIGMIGDFRLISAYCVSNVKPVTHSVTGQ